MIRTYSFTIEGNVRDRSGNPTPYLRRTQGSLWSKESIGYDDWLQYVRSECCKQTTLIDQFGYRGKKIVLMHPIELKATEYARMELMIWFKGEAHADPDNVFKGMADALFKNDKHLSHSVDFAHGQRGRIDVHISIFDAPEIVEPAKKRKGKKGLSRALK